MRESQGCTKPEGVTKVNVIFGSIRWDPEAFGRGRTTGLSQPLRRRGGARAYALGPERW